MFLVMNSLGSTNNDNLNLNNYSTCTSITYNSRVLPLSSLFKRLFCFTMVWSGEQSFFPTVTIPSDTSSFSSKLEADSASLSVRLRILAFLQCPMKRIL
jgi:hypothetical protein